MESCALFSSRSITEHLIRGALAFGAVGAAIHYEYLVWPLFIFLPAAFLLWRGCPACWAMGFYQTVQNKFDRNTPPPTDWMTHTYRFLQRKISRTPRQVFSARHREQAAARDVHPTPAEQVPLARPR